MSGARKALLISAVFFGIFAFAAGSFAAELYIDPKGNVRIIDGEIASLNNNVISTLLWGAKWVLFVDVTDSSAKVTNAAGEPITVWKLEKGHKIYVEGWIREVLGGKLEVVVKLLRDISIAGSGAAIPQPSIEPLKPILVQPPPPPAPPPAPVPVPLPTPAPTPPPSVQPPKAITPSPDVPRALLSRGAVGQEVRALQEVLLAEGYIKDDEVTGYFGRATEEGIKKLQTAYGLEQVGYVGPQTRKILAGLNTKTQAPGVAEVKPPAPKPAVKETSAKKLTSRLERGMTGEEVKLLQEALLLGGYIKEDEATGFFGLATEAGVKKLQKANGIAPEGFTGPLTRDVVNSLLVNKALVQNIQAPSPEPPPLKPAPEPSGRMITQTLKEGMSGREVVILQEFLQKNDWGIPDDGPVTGYYGGVTSKAVANFQQANGLESVGFVGQATRDLINKLLAK